MVDAIEVLKELKVECDYLSVSDKQRELESKALDDALLALEQKEKLEKNCLVCNTHNWATKCITCEMNKIQKERKQGALKELKIVSNKLAFKHTGLKQYVDKRIKELEK